MNGYEPTNQFEQFVVDQFKGIHLHNTNHMSHHGRLYAFAGALVVVLAGAVARLWLR